MAAKTLTHKNKTKVTGYVRSVSTHYRQREAIILRIYEGENTGIIRIRQKRIKVRVMLVPKPPHREPAAADPDVVSELPELDEEPQGKPDVPFPVIRYRLADEE